MTMRNRAVTVMSPASNRDRSDSLPRPEPKRPNARADELHGAVRAFGFRWRAQAVADAALGVDQRRPERVELAAQVADVGLHDLGLPGELPAPYVLQQLLPGEHPPLVTHQVREQPKLRRRELHLSPAAA